MPAIVDLASLRDAMKRLGGNPKDINPLVPVDLVIDHSVQVDAFRSYVAICHFNNIIVLIRSNSTNKRNLNAIMNVSSF